MPVLYVVGGGLFGSQAAAYARRQGVEAVVFDAGLPGAASPAAAGLFHERWLSKKWRAGFKNARALLEQLYEIRTVALTVDEDRRESFLCVPPSAILEPKPRRVRVDAVGDGWLEAAGQRYEGWVYVAAGVWSGKLVADVDVHGRAGAAFLFPGEHAGCIRQIAPGRQALAFARDPGSTYFSDGTAERDFRPEHEAASLVQAANLGLSAAPVRRLFGRRPYVPGGPLFRRLGARTWVATGGRKMGTVLGAVFAHRLVEEELLAR